MSGTPTSPDGVSRIDWDRIDALTDEDIAKSVAGDPDAAPINFHVGKTLRLKSEAPEVDVKAIRGNIGLSQAAFADRFGFTKRAVENWEQGIRRPDRAARILLWLIDRHPGAVDAAMEALRENSKA